MPSGRRKTRRTYSLDPELVRYVEKVRRERHSSSASSALEQLLWESIRERERQHQESEIAAYYSSMSENEVAEQKEWGKFAETQFPTEE